jgi:3-hydroxyisobutyrate dehydrogenase-like beta-hydroxyacid dehydrogenase
MTSPHATIAILSIGQMGLGIANLLRAHNYRVITNVSDRSAATQNRAKSASIELFTTDVELVQHADYVLSIVPPKDATSTAQRITAAFKSLAPGARKDKPTLWFLELNAGSPAGVTQLYDHFQREAQAVTFVDGGIIGAPPSQKEDGTWSLLGIPLSGPHNLASAPVDGARLASVLNTRYIGPDIGTATGLKACFAALSKGFTALALQSYTTASSLHVLPHLQAYLNEYNPSAKEKAEKSIVGCTSKAYRWVEEMHQIGQTFAEHGGFGQQASVFREIAAVYQGLADVVEQQGTEEGMGDAESVVGALGAHLKSGKPGSRK